MLCKIVKLQMNRDSKIRINNSTNYVSVSYRTNCAKMIEILSIKVTFGERGCVGVFNYTNQSRVQ